MKAFNKILILFLFCIYSKNNLSQTFQWVDAIGSSTTAPWAFDITTDPSGNVYSTGNFGPTNDFDPGAGVFNLTSIGMWDSYILKLDANGNFLWAKSFGSTTNEECKSIVTDALGNVYVTGYYTGTTDFDPGPGTYTVACTTSTPSGNADMFVSKFDPSGNFVWVKTIGSTGDDQGLDLTIDAAGDVCITGVFYFNVDFDPGPGTYTLGGVNSEVFVLKLNASGNFVWAGKIGGPSGDFGYSISTDVSNNIFVAGFFAGTADFDPGVGTFTLAASGFNDDIFVEKLNASGNFLWAKKMGGSGTDRAFAVTADAAGNVITTGFYSASSADFDPGPAVYTLGSAGDFISKLDALGNFVWAKNFPNTGGNYSVKTDASNNVYTIGDFTGTPDFDPGPGTYTVTSYGMSDAHCLKLDLNGNFISMYRLGSWYTDGMTALTLEPSGNIYTLGGFNSFADFDPGPIVYNVYTPGSSGNVFIHKMGFCTVAPATPGLITGSNTICSNATNLTYTLAPVMGASYSWTLPSGWSGTSSTNTMITSPGTSGVISVAATNLCGASPTQTFNVVVNPNPTITVSSGTVCIGQSFNLSPSGATSYTFVGGGPVVSPTVNSSYTVTGTSSAGCISTNTAISTVTALTTPTVNITVSTNTLCSGQSSTLSASGAATYSWNPGMIPGSSIVVTPTTTTTYFAIATGTNGCINNPYSQTTVTVFPLPIANAGSTQTINCAFSTVTLTGTGLGGYVWSGPGIVSGGNLPNATVNSPGTYSLTGISSAGCSSANTATVNVMLDLTPPSLSITPSSNAICAGDPVTLNAGGANTYSWNTGATSGVIVVTPSTSTAYVLTGTNTVNGCSSTTSTNITVNASPSVSVNSTAGIICEGGSVTLSASGTNTYSWSTGPSTSSIIVSPTTTTNYTVIGTNTTTGCQANSVITITVNPLPIFTVTTSDSLVCGPLFQETATLTVNGGTSYSWSTGNNGSIIVVSPTVTTTYTVFGYDVNGCSNTSVFTQSVSSCVSVYENQNYFSEIKFLPNPNNGVFQIILQNESECIIYDTNGKVIYHENLEKGNNLIDIRGENSGIYFVKVKDRYFKILKE